MPPRRVQIDMTVADFRQRFGVSEDQLPDDVSEDQLRAFLEANPPPGASASFAVPEGMVLVDEANWQRVQEEGRQLEDRVVEQERDHLIEAAIEAGKIPVFRRGHYQQLFESDPAGTRDLIASLAPDAIPVDPRARVNDHEGPVAASAYPSNWLPETGEQRQVVVGHD